MTIAYSKIAFIGLGQMGLPMAKLLMAAGFPVTGFDHSAEAVENFLRVGGVVGADLADTIADADCVITILPNGQIVQEVLLGDAAAINLASPTAFVIDMSSSAPSDTRALLARLPRSQRLIDAPVSGGVKRAVDGTLAIMAGGADDDIDAVLPLLEAMSAKIFRCGDVGSGHAMKAINNYVSGTGLIAAIEAVQLGEKFGLKAENIIDVLNASSGKNNATEVKMKQFILSGSFGSGFGLRLMAKDIRIAANLSLAEGLQQGQLQQTADIWDSAAREMAQDTDHTRIYEYLGSKN